MKGLILAGGLDTNLHPLTVNTPKPIVDFANKPMMMHQIEALKGVGITEVILAINCKHEVILSYLNKIEITLGITITCSLETEQLGTAGPLALAREMLVDGSGDPFFVLNGDVICEYPLAELIEYHKSHQGEATILVTKVDEPSKYGVVVMEEESGRVERFVEKPEVFLGNNINAGIYLLNPSVLERMELRPTSLEKEVFPKIAEERRLFAMVMGGFWMDIGQPSDYITGSKLYLESLERRGSVGLAFGPQFTGNVLVHKSATIWPDCLIGPDVVIGPWCKVESGVRLLRCTLMNSACVRKNSTVNMSILGRYSSVGKFSQASDLILGNSCCTGDDFGVLSGKSSRINIGTFVRISTRYPRKKKKNQKLLKET